MKPEISDPLKSQRQRIDQIDEQLVQLINSRAEVSREIGEIKHKFKMPIYVGSREKEVLDAVVTANKGLLADEDMVDIFRAIMKSSRNAQARLQDS